MRGGILSAEDWQTWGAAAWNLVFPPSCAACGNDVPSGSALCAPCCEELQSPRGERCPRCAAVVGPFLSGQPHCQHCRDEAFSFRRVLALGNYADRLQWSCQQGKQLWRQPLVMAMANLFWDVHREALLADQIDAVVPVPGDWSRRLTFRGEAPFTFGQRLAQCRGVAFRPDLLTKPRRTAAQARSAPSARRKQQKGAFATPHGLSLHKARLLLVDDVLTTGGTAQAATWALLKAGAADVTVCVFARGLGDDRWRGDPVP
jgi:competence protein ComFC